jgi:hypothetical protein
VKKIEPLLAPIAGVAAASSDGKRFPVADPAEGEAGTSLTVVQNWTAGLKK